MLNILHNFTFPWEIFFELVFSRDCLHSYSIYVFLVSAFVLAITTNFDHDLSFAEIWKLIEISLILLMNNPTWEEPIINILKISRNIFTLSCVVATVLWVKFKSRLKVWPMNCILDSLKLSSQLG